MRTLTRKQALKEGYVIDDYAARGPIGYKGPRFGPDCQWVPVLSEREEVLFGTLLYVRNALGFAHPTTGAVVQVLAELNIEGEV